MGRPKESGYRSQLLILLVLRDFGPLYGQEIVHKTGLHREEVWRNLKVLFQKGIVQKEKVGRKVYYQPDVPLQTLEYIIWILDEGGVHRIKEGIIRSFKKAKSYIQMLSAATQKAGKYEGELVELASKGEMEPYFENLPFAKSWYKTKKATHKAGLKPSVQLSKYGIEKIREQVKHPKEPSTKAVTVPSGAVFVIKKLTALEILDYVRKLNQQKIKRTHEIDPHLVEAVKRLTA